MDNNFFERSEALLSAETTARLKAAHVLVVGVGGVGGWCAEALVRTGLGRITLVDDDTVASSNVNRQCPATAANVGRSKVEAMRERLLAVNPECDVTACAERFTAENAGRWFASPSFSAVVDAIDSVDCKAELVLAATAAGVPLVSSMGAALRLDPTRVTVSRFEKVEGDGLARALRQRFKRLGRFPAAKFTCVWSQEPPVGARETKGSWMPVTATFGMCLASEAVKAIAGRDGR